MWTNFAETKIKQQRQYQNMTYLQEQKTKQKLLGLKTKNIDIYRGQIHI